MVMPMRIALGTVATASFQASSTKETQESAALPVAQTEDPCCSDVARIELEEGP
jgi:hypothetical protein